MCKIGDPNDVSASLVGILQQEQWLKGWKHLTKRKLPPRFVDFAKNEQLNSFQSLQPHRFQSKRTPLLGFFAARQRVTKDFHSKFLRHNKTARKTTNCSIKSAAFPKRHTVYNWSYFKTPKTPKTTTPRRFPPKQKKNTKPTPSVFSNRIPEDCPQKTQNQPPVFSFQRPDEQFFRLWDEQLTSMVLRHYREDFHWLGYALEPAELLPQKERHGARCRVWVVGSLWYPKTSLFYVFFLKIR